MGAEHLVTAAWLKQHLSDPDLVIADVRWYLDGRRGKDAYVRGHIPGAHFVDIDRELSSPPGKNGRHPLPDLETLARVLSRIGVTPNAKVVAYDDAGGSIAARFWWLLRWVNIRSRVLDGGIQAWTGELETATPPPREAPVLQLHPRRDLVADADEVALLTDDALLLDARAPERYAGAVEPIDARAGHIPGAKSAPYADNLVAGALRPAPELRERYAALGAEHATDIVCYCGSGVTACHDLLALAVAGFENARLYPGSWSEWAGDATRPIATGL